MRLPDELREARFLRRLNRFAADVEVDGRIVPVHVANSGRMHELLAPGNRTLLAHRSGPTRKTAYDLALVDLGHALVSADARLPIALLHEALAEGRVPDLAGYDRVRREVAWGHSRLDLLLEGAGAPCLVEVKSVTLVEDGVGLFPDAPTTRGRRHVEELARAVGEGYRAAVAFVVQREDAVAFAPHAAADPDFSRALRAAVAAGVEAYAFRCRVTLEEVRLAEPLPVLLNQPVASPAPSSRHAYNRHRDGTRLPC